MDTLTLEVTGRLLPGSPGQRRRAALGPEPKACAQIVVPSEERVGISCVLSHNAGRPGVSQDVLMDFLRIPFHPLALRSADERRFPATEPLAVGSPARPLGQWNEAVTVF